VFVIDANGGAERPVAATPAEELQPRWSPDGRQIVFAILDSVTSHGIARRVDGAWSVTGPFVVSTAVRTSVPQVNWSPDGRLLTTVIDGVVMVFALDGSESRSVGNLPARGYHALVSMWATDPRTLYVHAIKPGGTSVFLAVPVNGEAPRELVVGDRGQTAYRGEFATDGRRFFFTLPRIESDVSLMHLRR
jgi:Tol biopolymer transport system component